MLVCFCWNEKEFIEASLLTIIGSQLSQRDWDFKKIKEFGQNKYERMINEPKENRRVC